MSSTHGVIGFGSGPPGKIFSYQKIYLCKFPVGLTTRREVQAMGESGDRGDVDDRGRARLGSGDRGDVDDRGRARLGSGDRGDVDDRGRARLGSGDRGDVDDRGRARALPAQVSFQKNDSKRFESPVQMLVCLRGTFVRSGPPGKIFS